MMEQENLPAGWAKLTLGQVCNQVNERIMPSEVDGLPYVGLEHIERDSHRLRGKGYASDTTSLKSVFRTGDVLYGRLRPYLNKVVVAPFEGVCSTDIIVLRPTQLIDACYLLQILSNQEFLDYATARAKGINLPRLSLLAIMAYECAVPPFAEQRRILAALGNYLTSLDLIQKHLSAADEVIAALPSRIVAAATYGNLTEHCRDQQSDPVGSTDDRAIFADGSGPLPLTWASHSVGELGTVRKGRVRTPKDHQGPDMRPYLRVANVLEDQIDISDVMKMNFTPAEFERYHLQAGDILLNEGQSLELVGRPAIFRNELNDVCFTNSLVQFRSGPDIDPEFAILVFRHYLSSGVFSRIAKITTNLAHLGAQRFAALPFPLPPLKEQAEIARLGRLHLNRAQLLKSHLARIGSMLANLDSIVRSSALRGEMVSQIASERDVNTDLEERMLPDRATPKMVAPRRKGNTMKAIISLTQALGEATRALNGQQLFAAAGYPDEASSDLVERFYLNLREQISVGAIVHKERDGTDLFELSTGAGA